MNNTLRASGLVSLMCFIMLSACSNKNYSRSQSKCLLPELSKYQWYWENDSLGNYGFRAIFAELVLSKCNMVGKEWNSVRVYLGKPNGELDLDQNTKYVRYRLNNIGNQSTPGTLTLEIKISKGIIEAFKINEVDG